MTDYNKVSSELTEQEKNLKIEKLWLTYFNNTLFGKGLITEDERNKISTQIIHYNPQDDVTSRVGDME